MARNDGGRSTAGAVMVGMVIGGVLGATVALLFAPASGKETRRRIKDTTKDLRDRTADFIDETRDRVADFMEDSRDRINDLVTDGREEVAHAVSGVRGAVTEGRRAYRDRKGELASGPGRADAEHVPHAAPSDESSSRNGEPQSS